MSRIHYSKSNIAVRAASQFNLTSCFILPETYRAFPMLQKHTAFCAFSALAQHHQLFSPLDVIFPFKCVDLFCSSSLHYLWQFVHLLFRQTKRQTLNKYVFMTWNNVALVPRCVVTLCLLFATTRMSFILKKTRRKKKHSCSLISHILQRNHFEFSFFTENHRILFSRTFY